MIALIRKVHDIRDLTGDLQRVYSMLSSGDYYINYRGGYYNTCRIDTGILYPAVIVKLLADPDKKVEKFIKDHIETITTDLIHNGDAELIYDLINENFFTAKILIVI